MRVRRRTAGPLAAGLVTSLALSGCTTVVAGVAVPPGGTSDRGTVTVHLAEPGDVTDRLVRAAAADVLVWWGSTYPELYGGRFPGVAGGFWSVDPDETDPADLPGGACFPDDVADLAENAYHCTDDDVVVYDRAWLADLALAHGPFMVAEVVAHEVAHAVQAHAGLDDPSIVAETQAECFAGAWTRWVADGGAAHVTVRPEELDPYLQGYGYFGDAPGTAPDAEDAHGSLFDQLAAFQEGYADGARACAAFDGSREYTARAGDPDAAAGLPHRAVLAGAEQVLDAFWAQALTGGFPGTAPLGGRFAEPDVVGADGPGSVCTGPGPERDLQFCPDDGSVRYDDAGLLLPAHDDVGDFAVTALLALPYAMAVRAGRGLSVDDPAALASAACAAGWLARELHLAEVSGVRRPLAPGDVDEAAVVLLQHAGDPTVVPGPGVSGFALVDSFRRGFADGGDACDL